MRYAEITDGRIVQVIETETTLPAHKLRASLLPVEEVRPDYDPETHTLGAETLTIEASRVALSWDVIARPRPPVPEKVSNAQARFALTFAGFSIAEIDAIVAADPTGLYAIFWDQSPELRRGSQALQAIWAVLTPNKGKGVQQLSDELDGLFRAAEAIRP